MGRCAYANGLYERIYAVVHHIPPGQVATYGQIARMVGRCTARAVGYAMAALPCDTDVPWHRVINSQDKISPRYGSYSKEKAFALTNRGVWI